MPNRLVGVWDVVGFLGGSTHWAKFGGAEARVRRCDGLGASPRRGMHGIGPVRTRFAPSPTGMMHIGGLRTALYNYLLAKKTGGKFLLRIEDTDVARRVPGSQENIIEILEWTGVMYDEGPGREGGVGPYVQSERLSLYSREARLSGLRKHQVQSNAAPMYDRFCRHLSEAQIRQKRRDNVPHVVRLKIPEGETVIRDLVMGVVVINNRQLDDQILLKSDGSPTYHLASVVDDHLMGITHVIRGNEWLPSTPKHFILYNSLQWNPPEFLHLPILLNSDRSKLSKRSSHTAVQWYRDNGYLPEALVNFVALLGWNPGHDDYREIYSLRELVDGFSLDDVNRSESIVNIKKLNWFNERYIRSMVHEDIRRLISLFRPHLDFRLDEHGYSSTAFTEDYIERVLSRNHEGCCNLVELAERTLIFFARPDYNSEGARRHAEFVGVFLLRRVLETVLRLIEAGSEHDSLSRIVSECGKTLRESSDANPIDRTIIYKSLRFALCGSDKGPEVSLLFEVLGKEKTLERLNEALRHIGDV